jgi:hypothetical protein
MRLSGYKYPERIAIQNRFLAGSGSTRLSINVEKYGGAA